MINLSQCIRVAYEGHDRAELDRLLKIVDRLQAADEPELLRRASDLIREIAEICRQWEPDDSSGRDRRHLVLARDVAKQLDDAADRKRHG